MNNEFEEFVLSCAASDCDRKIARGVLEGAVTAQPIRPCFAVRRFDGEWVAYRGPDGDVDHVLCPEHRASSRSG